MIEKDDIEVIDFTADMEAMGIPLKPWYKYYFPFSIICYRNKKLRMFTFVLWDCTHIVHPVTKKHFFDYLTPAYRKWWQPPICGFILWI